MSKLEVKVKRLSDKAVLPEYQSSGAAGMDLVATKVTFFPGKNGPYDEIETDLAFEIPKGHVGLIFPRSSITTKTTRSLGNGVGVIDSDYRGPIKFQFRHVNQFVNSTYKPGDRIGQIIILPIPSVQLVEVDKLSDTDRSDGGFGSTGN